jgi:hypothetical protein
MATRSSRSRTASIALGLAASLLLPAAALGVTTVSHAPSTGLLVTGDATGEGLGVKPQSRSLRRLPLPDGDFGGRGPGPGERLPDAGDRPHVRLRERRQPRGGGQPR